MKREFVPPHRLSGLPLPECRFRSFPTNAESNTPMHRFVKATKHEPQSGDNRTSPTQQTERSETAPDGTTTSRTV